MPAPANVEVLPRIVGSHHPSECEREGHQIALTFGRPWQRLWRKTFYLRCWSCDLKVETPEMDMEELKRIVRAQEAPTVPYGTVIDG